MSTWERAAILLLATCGVVIIGLQLPWGWGLWVAGAGTLFLARRAFAKDIALIYVAVALLGVTPITTDISYSHMALMATTLILAIAVPYGISHYVYREQLIRFRFHHGRRWFKKEIAYIVFTAVLSYFLLPPYLRTGAYLNWSVEPGVSFLTRLFVGTNGLGIWDELFFISVVLGSFRRWMPFLWANLAQAVLFTSFLYELGFTGFWGPPLIFFFALIQGVVFKKTDSLLYVITIHLTMDLILYLALIHAHHPDWMPIFVT